jgi:hypothetical protein
MKNEESDWIAGLIFDGAAEMTELQRQDVALVDPLEKFLSMRSQELFVAKSAAGAEQPSWDDVIGADHDDGTNDDNHFHLEKRLVNFEKRSSSPFKLRESIEVIDGERVVMRYNHRGEVECMCEFRGE